MENIEECINGLNSRDSKTRKHSYFKLVHEIGKQAIPALINTMKSNKYPKNYLSRVWCTIINIGGPEAEEFFMNILRDNNNSYKIDAVAALGEMKAKCAVPFLIESIQDKNFNIRLNSIVALGLIADPAAVPYLRVVLKDSNPKIFEIAIFSLIFIGDVDSIIFIRALLNHRLADVRMAALAAMGHMGSKCDLQVLNRMVECDRSGNIRDMVSTVVLAIESMERIPRKVKVITILEITNRTAFDPHNEVFVKGEVEEVGHILRVYARFEEAYNTEFGWVGQEYVEII